MDASMREVVGVVITFVHMMMMRGSYVDVLSSLEQQQQQHCGMRVPSMQHKVMFV